MLKHARANDLKCSAVFAILRAFIFNYQYVVFEISGITAVRDRATASQG